MQTACKTSFLQCMICVFGVFFFLFFQHLRFHLLFLLILKRYHITSTYGQLSHEFPELFDFFVAYKYYTVGKVVACYSHVITVL